MYVEETVGRARPSLAESGAVSIITGFLCRCTAVCWSTFDRFLEEDSLLSSIIHSADRAALIIKFLFLMRTGGYLATNYTGLQSDPAAPANHPPAVSRTTKQTREIRDTALLRQADWAARLYLITHRPPPV